LGSGLHENHTGSFVQVSRNGSLSLHHALILLLLSLPARSSSLLLALSSLAAAARRAPLLLRVITGVALLDVDLRSRS